MGLSANLMSLGGLAIGIGMMVDGAVVMVENIHRHLTEPDEADAHLQGNKVETVLYAAKEVGRPIVFGIFIIIIVFLPLFTLARIRRKNVQPARLHDFFRAARFAHSFAHARADALHLFSEAGAAGTRSVSHPLAEERLSATARTMRPASLARRARRPYAALAAHLRSFR